jgi:hypothetical protein
MGGPFAGRGGAVCGPVRRRFIFPEGRLRRLLGVPVPLAGKVGQEKRDGTPYRFLNACCFWRQHRSVPHLWPWSESETEHLGRDSILSGHYDRPGDFSIFPKNYQSKLHLQGFRYANHIYTSWPEKLRPFPPVTWCSPNTDI